LYEAAHDSLCERWLLLTALTARLQSRPILPHSPIIRIEKAIETSFVADDDKTDLSQ
jgi:hypothetical protein